MVTGAPPRRAPGGGRRRASGRPRAGAGPDGDGQPLRPHHGRPADAWRRPPAASGAAREAAFAYVVTPNAQHLALLQDPQGGLAKPYAGAWLRVNDSRVLAGLMRLLFGTRLPVVNGSDLTLRLLRGLRPEDPVTVIGGDADLALRLRRASALREVALRRRWASWP